MTNLAGLSVAITVIAFTACVLWAVASKRATPRSRARAIVVISVVVVGFCAYGFYSKFSELILTYRDDPDGAFAITPILNYLLASLGFLCLLVWAALRGMFHDIEAPKRTMLDNEAWLDRREGRSPG